MLALTKHTHPDRTVVSIALLLLARMRRFRVEEYETLRTTVKKVAGGDALFLPALSFLFLLGLVEYRPKNDTVEYVGPK